MRVGATPEEWIHADVVLGLTPYLLPTVCNREAPIASYSKLKKPGKIPSRYTRDGQVVGFTDWSIHTTTDEEIQSWSQEADYGLCIRTGQDSVCAWDLDLEDAGVVAEVVAIIVAEAGGVAFPTRTRANSPRQLLLFRTDPSTPRFKQTITLPCGIIELLAKGQQFVACGEHESGVRYAWPAGLFEAPLLTDTQILAIQQVLAARFGEGEVWTAPRVTRERTDEDDEAVAAADPVVGYLAAHGHVKGTPCASGAIPVTCPNVASHGKVGDETQTVYFRAGTGGFEQGHVVCLDAACAGKKDADFLQAWGYTDWVMLSGFEVIPAVTEPEATQALVAGVASGAGVASPLSASRILDEYLDVRHAQGSRLALTDVGMTERFIRLLDGRARYVPETGEWWLWDGRWIRDLGGAMLMAHTIRISRLLRDEAALLLQRGGLRKHVDKILEHELLIQQKSRIDAVLGMTQKHPTIHLPLARLDAHPLRLGLDEGRALLDLTTGETRQAVPDDYLTKSLGVATCGQVRDAVRWRAFLDEVFEHRTDLISWLQRWCGYLLTAQTDEHCLLFLYGHGRNGKSVFLSTLQTILGDYGTATPAETLTESTRSSQGASPDIARLAGMRLVTASETGEGRAFAEGLLKELTGGDRMSARHLFKESFTFTPQFKIMLAGNHKPVVVGNDLGIWRRLHLVPFTRTFSEAEADHRLTETLKQEREAILGWMVEGAKGWLEGGLGRTPQVVKDATHSYRTEMDTLGECISDEFELGKGFNVRGVVAYEAYKGWAERCGLKVLTLQGFNRKITEREGVVKNHTNAGARLDGIRLKEKSGTGYRFDSSDLQKITCDELL